MAFGKPSRPWILIGTISGHNTIKQYEIMWKLDETQEKLAKHFFIYKYNNIFCFRNNIVPTQFFLIKISILEFIWHNVKQHLEILNLKQL